MHTIDGSWNVSVQPGRGAPASITMDQLTSWNKSVDGGVKYYGREHLHDDDPGTSGVVQAETSPVESPSAMCRTSRM
jgi:hypothetical protein